jgi:hypothetical protein
LIKKKPAPIKFEENAWDRMRLISTFSLSW